MAYTTADAQFLRDKDNKLIVKEFSVFLPDFKEDIFKVATFGPPYGKQYLPKNIKMHNRYVTNNIHGLSWDDGEYSFYEMDNILWSMTYRLNVIYVKGAEKAKVLQSLLPYLSVINIEVLGCPSLDKLPLFDAACENEVHVRFPRLSCASKNAKRLGLWLRFYESAKV